MKNLLLISFLAFGLVFSSCKKDNEDPIPEDETYAIPADYNFSPVDYSESTTRISMMSEIDTETGKGTTSVVSATKLKDMFTNVNSQFTSAALNTSGLELKDHTLLSAQAEVEKFMDSVALSSQSVVAYSNGVAGVATASNGTSKYLLATNGVEYRQVISKFLMGTLLFHQIRDGYLADTSVGNSVPLAKMQHNWDLAFGAFGVSIYFPDTLAGRKYLGNYSNQVTQGINSNTVIMDAFIKGRAAINNNDMATKDAQVDIIVAKLEELLAAAAIHELNAAKTTANIADVAARSHLVSEAMGFVLALKYMGTKMTPAQADAILSLLGTSNLYNISPTNINNALDYISTIYGFDSVKSII